MNTAGRMLVKTIKPSAMKINPLKNTKTNGGPLPSIIQKPPLNEQIPTIQYISALVVKKRNIALELQGIENNVYDIIAFFNNDKACSVCYANYKPVDTQEWRILGKSVKKIPFNTDFNLDECETINA